MTSKREEKTQEELAAEKKVRETVRDCAAQGMQRKKTKDRIPGRNNKSTKPQKTGQ
jgi:hypothetical protein